MGLKSMILERFGLFDGMPSTGQRPLASHAMQSNPAIRMFMVFSVLALTSTSTLHADDMVTHWNKVMLATISDGGTDPITSTRTAAIVQPAVFDSVNGIHRKYAPIHANFPQPEGASASAAIVESAYTALVALYPDQHRDLKAERNASLMKIHDSHEAIKRGREFGTLVAEDILNWRSTDGFDDTQPPFLGGTNIGQWRPTPPDFRPGALPQLATSVPWVLQSPSQFRPDGPPSLTSAEYAAVFNEVKTMGSADSSVRTPEQTLVALFWAGNTPGFWNRIAGSVVVRHPRLSLLRKARIFALLNLAMADAAIACWDAKYRFQFWRPITAITNADLDGNPDTEVDPNWTPLLGVTPAHPEYISGHSTISAAAAWILSQTFGDKTPFLIDSEKVPGVWLAYPSFSSTVLDVNNARVFAGIHYRSSCLDGNGVGRAVAHFVMKHSMRPDSEQENE